MGKGSGRAGPHCTETGNLTENQQNPRLCITQPVLETFPSLFSHTAPDQGSIGTPQPEEIVLDAISGVTAD